MTIDIQEYQALEEKTERLQRDADKAAGVLESTMATLKEIQGDVFVFEQTIGGGTMTFKLRREEINSLSTR